MSGKAGKNFLILFLFFTLLGAASLKAASLYAEPADVLTPFTGSVRPYAGKAVPEITAARAGIAPHHGLASETIARFYNSLPGDAELVILLGPDHFNAGRRSVSLCPQPWRAGDRFLSALEPDASAAAALSQAVGVESLPFRLEHSIGLHIGFIARRFPKAKVAALMVKNSAAPRELLRLVPALSALLAKEGTLMILSMDFSHEKMPEEARREDDKSIEHLLSFRTENLRGRGLDIDAPAAAWLFLETLKSLGIKRGLVLERTNSSEITGRSDMPCTSYATVIFSSDEHDPPYISNQ